MIPVMLGLGSLLTKVAAAAVVPRIVKALSALGGPPEPVRAHPSQEAKDPGSESAPELEKSLYGRKPLLRHTRAYDAANKRWISRDPLGEGVDYNLYRYCGNSPINWRDTPGLEPGENPHEWELGDSGIFKDGPSSYHNTPFNIPTRTEKQGTIIIKPSKIKPENNTPCDTHVPQFTPDPRAKEMLDLMNELEGLKQQRERAERRKEAQKAWGKKTRLDRRGYLPRDGVPAPIDPNEPQPLPGDEMARPSNHNIPPPAPDGTSYFH